MAPHVSPQLLLSPTTSSTCSRAAASAPLLDPACGNSQTPSFVASRVPKTPQRVETWRVRGCFYFPQNGDTAAIPGAGQRPLAVGVVMKHEGSCPPRAGCVAVRVEGQSQGLTLPLSCCMTSGKLRTQLPQP